MVNLSGSGIYLEMNLLSMVKKDYFGDINWEVGRPKVGGTIFWMEEGWGCWAV